LGYRYKRTLKIEQYKIAAEMDFPKAKARRRCATSSVAHMRRPTDSAQPCQPQSGVRDEPQLFFWPFRTAVLARALLLLRQQVAGM
jgi:hypothetical protein